MVAVVLPCTPPAPRLPTWHPVSPSSSAPTPIPDGAAAHRRHRGLVADSAARSRFRGDGPAQHSTSPRCATRCAELHQRRRRPGPTWWWALLRGLRPAICRRELPRVPYGARIETDIARGRPSRRDFTRSLAAMKLKARITIDAARNTPYVKKGSPLAGGLAMVDAEAGTPPSNTAPGSIVPDAKERPVRFAPRPSARWRTRTRPPDQVFTRLRPRQRACPAAPPCRGMSTRSAPTSPSSPARTDHRRRGTGGRQGWPTTPPRASPPSMPPMRRSMSLRRSRRPRYKPADPVEVAVAKPPVAPDQPISDVMTIEDALCPRHRTRHDRGLRAFLAVWPEDALSKRIVVVLPPAARRRPGQTRDQNSANAYWSYLKRYPEGFSTSRRRPPSPARLNAAAEAPATFEEVVIASPRRARSR